jgi:hypothetical protein
MWFVFSAFVFMFIGRYVGWALSRGVFYPAPIAVSLIGMVLWGIGVGWCMSGLIGWQHPNAVLKWIFGFALAAYVSIPNYGLVNESTIPAHAQPRHMMIQWVPFIVYIATEFATASMR